MRLAVSLFLALLASCRCGEPLETLVAQIAVDPDHIDFSTQRVGAPTTASIQVGNRGTGALTLATRFEPADQGFAIHIADTVRNGLAERGVVTFTPPAQGDFAADLVLSSNDAVHPEVRVPITGTGGPPALTIDPDPLSFGVVNEGVGSTLPVHLTNSGYDVLSLTSASLEDGSAFALDASLLPVDVAPGDHVDVAVSLAPSATVFGPLADTLHVSFVGGEGTSRIDAIGNRAPVAVAVELISRRDVVKVGVGRAVVVDGSETADPDGDPFTLLWSVSERPAASTAALVGVTSPTTRVTPDVVGRYVVALRATDVHGAFSDATVEILPRDLAVVLTWTASGAASCRAFSDAQCAAMSQSDREQNCCGQSDLDLHVVRPSGALGDYGACPATCDVSQCGEFDDADVACRQTGTDCAYANRAPEWGQAGRVDDPRLDVDDVRGDGPEITSLDDPEDGAYRVVVHYCLDRLAALNAQNSEPTLATLTIFEEGQLAFTSAPEPLTQGKAWTAATLIRQNGAWNLVAPPGVVDDAPADLCTR